jgi:carboxyl-terminal processing protease
MNRRFHFALVATSTCIVMLLLFGAVRVRSAAPEEPYTQLGVYSDVLTKIKVEYVEEPDIKAVTVGAINGLLESLDPFASYLNADQYKQYQRERGTAKGEVGLFLSRGPGYLRVVSALPGSPADKAGLSTGDVVESINKISTRDMPLAFAELLLAGEPNSSVEMSVLTPRQADPQTLTLSRAVPVYPQVEARLVSDKGPEPIGLISTVTLQEGRVDSIRQKIQELEKQGAKKFLLDLRNCTVGPTEQGIALANLFMDQGLITYTLGQKSKREEFQASSSRAVTKLPLVVMTNRGTAGAAEVAAAALLESKRAQLVGEPTFGNAAVRKALTLDDGSAVILAVAKYYSPSGKPIQDQKVTPNVIQIQAEAVDPEGGPAPATRPPDAILQRGYDVITAPPAQGK